MSSDDATDDAPAVFSVLWALAIVVHPVAKGLFTPVALAGALVAIWVLLEPTSWRRLAAMAAVQVAGFVLQFPEVSNHWMLVTAVDVALLASLLPELVRSSSASDDESSTATWRGAARRFVPVTRLLVLATYALAVFHKLNWDYLDPSTSCAVVLVSQTAGTWVSQPPFATAVVWGSLATEATIPALLAFRRTRIVGIALGLSFHTAVALTPGLLAFDFTMAVCALYWLFLPREASRRLRLQIREWLPAKWADNLPVVVQSTAVGFALLYVLQVLVARPSGVSATADYLRHVGRLVTLLLSAGGLAAAIWLFWAFRESAAPTRTDTVGLRPSRGWQILLLALFLLNGLSPYLGLKTTSSLSMFSNLRTEGNESNHLVLGARADVFELQRDLVRIVATDDPALHDLEGTDVRIPYATFLARASRRGSHTWTIETARGRRHTFRSGDLPPPRHSWIGTGIRFTEVTPSGRCFP